MLGDLLRIIGMGCDMSVCKHEHINNPHPQALQVWCYDCQKWINKIG